MFEKWIKKHADMTRGNRFRKVIQYGGSLSLALCIILPAVLLLFSEVIKFSRSARADSDLARSARIVTDAALAHYDRDLYKTFGLFGVNEYEANKAMSDVLYPNAFSRMKLELNDELKEGEQILNGIARHMTWRASTSIIVDAIDKIKAMKPMGEEIALSSLADYFPPALVPGYEVVDPSLDHFEEVPDWKDEYEALMDSEIRSVYHQGLTHLAPILIPRENDDEHETLFMNPFDNSGLQRFGEVIDKILFVAPEGILDRLLLSEYTLSYFSNNVPFVLREGMRFDDHTPDGRIIAQFSESRCYEAEEIATGLKGKNAKTAVLVFIASIRFAIHFLKIITNEASRSTYKTAAAVIAASVSAVTLGKVSIPPEAVEWILMASAALGKGAIDATAINKGKEVELWPDKIKVNVKLRYRDFIRLLILAQSPQKIARRIATIIDRVFPSPYYTSVACLVTEGNRALRFEASYLNRLPAPEEIEP